ncbi:MAG: HAD-IIB family hydrolase [Bryobacteraceae bacterium]
MKVIFSDLDGTLLHPHSYSFEAAEPALAALRRRNTPLVLCTSKTRAEVELWRGRLKIEHPFIVENGGAVYVPSGCFPFAIDRSVRRDGYDVVEFGTPYPELVAALEEAAREAKCEVLGFQQMSLADICLRTSLPVQQAALAKQREYDEPFEILGPGAHALLEAIERSGKRWTRGDRFYHITGANDKAVAVEYLIKMYRRAFGSVRTVGIGDGPNDAKFLTAVDIPVIIRSPYAAALKRAVPNARVTTAPGPHGWNEAVLPLVTQPGVRAGRKGAPTNTSHQMV